MSTDLNQALARRFVAEHNQADYMACFDALLAPDCVVHEYLPGLPPALDRAGYNQFIASFRAALPDIHNVVEDVIADGDKIAIRWSGYGTHTGAELIGLPATGRQVQAHGIYMLRFADGKIAEVWNHWDNFNVAQQLGG